MPREIRLTRGMVAIVDDDDYQELARFKWQAVNVSGRKWYACRSIWRDGKSSRIYMHRQITGAGAGDEVDHVDGDGLNNRTCNLRLATRSQNCANRATRKPGLKFKGVYPAKRDGFWRAYIAHEGKQISLGWHDSQEKAARAYDQAALRFYGAYARLNFPHEDFAHE